jgi:hypothetical protein
MNGAFILGPTNVTICASAFDPDGTVASVTFFEGSKPLGTVASAPTVWVTNRHGVFPIQQTSYALTWSNVAPGSYSLTAEAIDNGGIISTSAAVEITIVTNLPPVVKLVEPEENERFYSPATIEVCAVAHDPDGTVAQVEFFSNAKSLGVVTNGTTVTNRDKTVWTYYSLTLTNLPPATNTLDAVVTDNDGATGTSAPIRVIVVAPPTPLAQIVYPPNGAKFVAPATVPIAAVARYFAHPIASVQFQAGTNILGVLTNSWWPTYYWKQVPPGAYSLTILATDTGGVSATSAPINITVVSNSPPRLSSRGR